MALSIDQDDTSSLSEFTEYTEDAESGSIRPRTNEDSIDITRKRRKTEIDLWSHTREPKGNEPLRDKHHHQIYYCRHCPGYSGSPIGERFRSYLLKYNIRVPKKPDLVKIVAFNNLIIDILVFR